MNQDKTTIYNLEDCPDTWAGFLVMAAAHKHNRIAPISCSQIEYLAQCPCYEREAGDMAAAYRGTALHLLMSIPEESWPLDLPAEELSALNEARKIERAYIAEVVSRETSHGGGLYDFGGTTDMIGYTAARELTIVDYKFGGQPKRSDSIQLIAYARLMNASHTLVIQPGVLPHLHQVTGEDHDRLADALTKARGKDPTSCELCGQCSKRETCPALHRDMEIVAQMDPKTISLPVHPDDLGKLMGQIASAETICETIRDRIKALLVSGAQVTGWKTSTSKRQTTAWQQLAEAKCSPDEIAKATSIKECVSMRRCK
jgi:hypothetical protein